MECSQEGHPLVREVYCPVEALLPGLQQTRKRKVCKFCVIHSNYLLVILNHRTGLVESAYKYQLLGLNLLYLLSQNRVAEFHTELELLPPDQIHNVYIKHPLSIEQYLMEGRYNRVSFLNFRI
jgi:hypothetical protein